jgi:hypothetical protein
MQGNFGDFDDSFEAWTAAHPSWRSAGLAAAGRVAAASLTFTTVDVWREWRGPEPEEKRAMAAVMSDAIDAGYCRRVGVATGHTRRAGHAGFGALYQSLIYEEGGAA